MIEIEPGSSIRHFRLAVSSGRLFPGVKIKDDIKKVRRESDWSVLAELYRISAKDEGASTNNNKNPRIRPLIFVPLILGEVFVISTVGGMIRMVRQSWYWTQELSVGVLVFSFVYIFGFPLSQRTQAPRKEKLTPGRRQYQSILQTML
jgi:hypothetical protein